MRQAASQIGREPEKVLGRAKIDASSRGGKGREGKAGILLRSKRLVAKQG